MTHILASTGLMSGMPGISTDGILPTVSGLVIVSIGPAEVADDGGWLVTATGLFPALQPVKFQIQGNVGPDPIDRLCYSGVGGNAEWCWSTDGATIEFVVPPLPVTGVDGADLSFDVYAESEDGLLTASLADALTVVRRTFPTHLYSLRANHAPPRDVGPYQIEDEER